MYVDGFFCFWRPASPDQFRVSKTRSNGQVAEKVHCGFAERVPHNGSHKRWHRTAFAVVPSPKRKGGVFKECKHNRLIPTFPLFSTVSLGIQILCTIQIPSKQTLYRKEWKHEPDKRMSVPLASRKGLGSDGGIVKRVLMESEKEFNDRSDIGGMQKRVNARNCCRSQLRLTAMFSARTWSMSLVVLSTLHIYISLRV